MLFNDILDVHNSYQPEGSHSDILGDGFMMSTNPIYRNIKSFSSKIGCKFVEAHLEYLLLPFHELPAIVESKEIPYIPSARLMKNVELSHPGVFTTEDMPVPPSYHLHEAAHVIAEHFLEKLNVKTREEKILKMILAESFANTVDAFVCKQATDDIHYFFIKQNSYMHPQKKIVRAMTTLTKSMGFHFTFMLALFTYVRANFLTRPLSKKEIQELVERYAPGVKVGATIQKDIRTICEVGEKLDPRFRFTTTSNYFKQQGFEGEIQDLLGFDFMKVFAENPGFRKATESLSDSIA